LAVADDSATDEIGQLAHRLNSMAKDLQGLLALRQELATMEERNRLARDLHDTVKQQVFALAMQIGAAQRISDGTSPEITKRLTEAERLTRQAQQELVAIIKEVLREQVADWSRQSGVTAEVNYDGASSLPRQVEQSFFRIAQEALANIARHSRATRAVVEVSAVNGDARLSIMDNGTGFDPGDASVGMGLQNMRERAEALPGGWFKIEASEAKGARVVAGCRTETVKKG
jgi:NarL family two-component system sensor histidine kinase LiaS